MSNDQKKSASTDATATAKLKKPDAKHPPKPKKEKQLHALQTYTGTVGAYGANPEGLYDRFTLDAAGQAHTVKFPPHFGEQAQALAQPGQPVAVLGFVHTTPKGDEHLHLARLDAAGTSARPLSPTATAATLTGTIAELRLDPKGRLHGLRLTEEATELRLPPHLSEQLAAKLVPGATITAYGQQPALKPGEVAAHPAPMPVELLTLGDEAYLVH